MTRPGYSRRLLALSLILCPLFTTLAFAEDLADTLYLGGPIITVNDEAPRAEAVAVKDGKILAVGAVDALAPYRGNETKIFDFSGTITACY